MRVYDVHEDGRGVDSDEAVCFFGYIAVPAPQGGVAGHGLCFGGIHG